jgi:Domain of unknown function (DUF6532)
LKGCASSQLCTLGQTNVIKQLSAIGPRFRADVKAKIRPLVERFYQFETGVATESLTRNTERARDLKTDLAYINGENGQPYHHPIIQQAINVIWFSDRHSEGIMFSSEFSPMPYEAIALVLTVVIKSQMIHPERRLSPFHDIKRSIVALMNGVADLGMKSSSPMNTIRRHTRSISP